ncbi:hypothetical protein Pedsa_3624 [Pseudopedobacter saltans DSM 12145]|uniref:Uncharacterized protein n=1 Tax=Pseudopedobacter saltans (strain ATCC 51119 / DSM 12145 / JCM 21818 / CCUG 39354 / LMG 10337 / NBRC 100064 / NCIMB 13643) TaxID=762903 RepID=F0S4X9_PSESL|nr:hypothetical protein Pedsa_3624 [Pseudopedobacter saltans DSM 12145]
MWLRNMNKTKEFQTPVYLKIRRDAMLNSTDSYGFFPVEEYI